MEDMWSKDCQFVDNNKGYARASRLANALGLRPVGWIFTHDDGRCSNNENDDDTNNDVTDVNGDDDSSSSTTATTLPMRPRDIHTAARCQVASLLQSSTTSTKTESISSKK